MIPASAGERRKERKSAKFCLTPVIPQSAAPLSMGFSRQEHWSGLPLPSPGDLPDQGVRTQVSRITGRCFTDRAIVTKQRVTQSGPFPDEKVPGDKGACKESGELDSASVPAREGQS